MILNVLGLFGSFVLVLAPLVFIHELGHFLAAKLFGIRVPVFSLGFGPRMIGFVRGDTDYRLSLIPLGGYVRMAGDEADEHRTGADDEFLSKPRWQRFVVFVAGATFNIVLAFLALWALFSLYGIEVPEAYPTIYAVEQDSTAEQAGVRVGDKIIAINGKAVRDAQVFMDTYILDIALSPNKDVEIRVEREGATIDVPLNTGMDEKDGSGSPGWSYTWQGSEPAVIQTVYPGEPAEEAGLLSGDKVVSAGDHDPISELELRLLIKASADKEVPLTVERGDERRSLVVVPRLVEEFGGRVGIDFKPSKSFHRDLNLVEAAGESLRANLALSKTLFVVLKRLLTREVSMKTMSGPIGIAQFAQRAIVVGPDALLYMLGFISLQLGILNLMPIPVLDGGHILLLGIESVMRRELSDRLKERFMQVGLVFLLAMMAVVILQDVLRIF